jgi:glyoxylase-like metal-dependent hydrolase (beta-lactamase superfamily II)
MSGSGTVRQERLPASEEVTEVAPGVLRVQLSVSLPGLGHVNCYALEDERGFALVDPGLPGPAPWRELHKRLGSAQIPLDRVHTVVITHSHPDHFGAAARIREVTGAELVTHDHFKTFWDPDEEDDEHKELADRSDPDAWAVAKERLIRVGRSLWQGGYAARWNRPTPWGGKHPRPDLRTRSRYRLQGTMLAKYFRPPKPSTRVRDGQMLTLGRREWQAVHTPGHTVDHLCLLDPVSGTLLSGDHVLPTITPHISGLVRAEDPLRLFIESLDRVAALRGVQRVLPAHGHPFDDLAGRAGDIQRHHTERLARLCEAARELGEAPVESYSQKLFKPTSWGPMADSETYAHLEHLRHQGLARRRHAGGQLLYAVEPG